MPDSCSCDGDTVLERADPSTVTVRDGKVVQLTDNLVSNGIGYTVMQITRERGHFHYFSDCPDVPGISKRGDLAKVLTLCNPHDVECIEAALSAENPTQQQLEELFPGWEIIFE